MQSNLPKAGLGEVIAGEVSPRRAFHTVELSPELRLDLLTLGQIPISATDLFRSEEADSFFASISDDYDLVLVDTPPLFAGCLLEHSLSPCR